VPTPPGVPTPVPTPVPVTVPTLPSVPVPVPAPTVGPVVLPPVVDPSLVPQSSLTTEAPPLPNGANSPFAAPRVPSTNGLISRSTAGLSEGTSMPPGGLTRGMRNLTRRAPGEGEPPVGGRANGRRDAGESNIQREPGSEDLFGGRGMSAPPVLGNNRKSRSRTSLPPAVTSDEISTGRPGRAGAVPPILARTAKSTTRTTRPAAPSKITETGTDVMAPALHAPAPPVGGADVSGLEEVPSALRTPSAAVAVRATQAAPRELVNRNSTRGVHGVAADDLSSSSAPPTAEEAFSVETPSGGVLAARQPTQGYVAEPKAQVRAS
jgi:hypothetical protein